MEKSTVNSYIHVNKVEFITVGSENVFMASVTQFITTLIYKLWLRDKNFNSIHTDKSISLLRFMSFMRWTMVHRYPNNYSHD